MKVVWSEKAERQLRAIHAFIAQDSEQYARRLVDRITNRTEQIGRFPQSGRITPEFGIDTIRELIEGSYRVIYEIRPDIIVIATVVHSATNTDWR